MHLKPNLQIRTHQEKDRLDFEQCPRDPNYYSSLGLPFPSALTREQEGAIWLEKNLSLPYSWAIVSDGHCIGSSRIHSIEHENRRARYAIEIFNPQARGKGFGTLVTQAVMKIAFDELHLHRLDLRVLSTNAQAIACYEKCGFKREGILRDTLYLEGQWLSDLWMSVLENEFILKPAV